MPKEIVAIKRLAREHCEEAIRALLTMARESDSEKIRLEAWEAILDRGLGKPKQELEVDGNIGMTIPQIVRQQIAPKEEENG